jgi:hypothetical protein
MSDQEFENYLTLIGRLLRLSSSQRKAIGEELRDHFESRVAELVQSGLLHEEAVRMAVEEFGDAAGLAAQFTTVSQTRKRRLIMRGTVGTVAALAAAIVIGMASWPDHNTGLMVERAGAQTAEKQKLEKADIATRDRAARETERMLNVPIDVEFQETPLAEVLQYLRDSRQIQIVLRSGVLSDAGIDPTTILVSTSLSKVRGAKVLGLILEANGLGYMIDNDGLVIVSTKEDLDSRLTIRIYDCRKILASESAIPAPVPAEPANNQKQSKPKTPADKLVNVICTTIFSNTWSEMGGPGTVSEYGGLLVVCQTQAAHEEIADLLEQLSEKLAAPAK